MLEGSFKGKHFLALEDFEPEQIRYLLDLSAEMKRQKKEKVNQQRNIGSNMLMLFEMESTRTRCAFETSAQDLGMGTTYLSNSHFGSKETIKDSMRVFSEMYDVIAYRGTDHAQLVQMAAESEIPVINGYTMHEHPTQMLADFMTLDEAWGREGYRGKTFTYIGRGGACCAFSYAVACAMLGMNFRFITSYMTLEEAVALLSPEEQEMFYREVPRGSRVDGWSGALPDEQKALILDLYARYNPDCTFLETEDVAAIEGTDVVSTENWGFFTNKAITWLPGIMKYRDYQVNRELMARTGNPDAIFLHMLPATHNGGHAAARKLIDSIADPEIKALLERGFEVTDEVFEDNAAHIFREAGNRQHTIKAVTYAVMGNDVV
ncbi:ornithine carbamoyltransferase [Adlercreutzia sp. R25]|uniref:ornithine carbamoyltransferase n=1 Tax=Adlercreutzia shanghongiae TaxID=3111773 RepID=A0ABU6J1D6_9ACTN|nr:MULTISPECIES: ornithine carbamoyltransferase [unclassified Adlercreutzia]MEC4273515.1 ornithine carbamoyltransferase [Adlercreutzia sp. R25]MEC4295954.1 ornithine carbamoyltransferase [Adlercreutzia sp. R22]